MITLDDSVVSFSELLSMGCVEVLESMLVKLDVELHLTILNS